MQKKLKLIDEVRARNKGGEVPRTLIKRNPRDHVVELLLEDSLRTIFDSENFNAKNKRNASSPFHTPRGTSSSTNSSGSSGGGGKPSASMQAKNGKMEAARVAAEKAGKDLAAQLGLGNPADREQRKKDLEEDLSKLSIPKVIILFFLLNIVFISIIITITRFLL